VTDEIEMTEQSVNRLSCSHSDCVQRFRERARLASQAGDVKSALQYMQFVPQVPQEDRDRPKTPPPADFDFS